MNWILLSLLIVTLHIGAYSQSTAGNVTTTPTLKGANETRPNQNRTAIGGRYLLHDNFVNEIVEVNEKLLPNGAKVHEKKTKVEYIEITTKVPDNEHYVSSKIVYEASRSYNQLIGQERKTKSKHGMLAKIITIMRGFLRNNKKLSKNFRSILEKYVEKGRAIQRRKVYKEVLTEYFHSLLRDVSNIDVSARSVLVNKVNEIIDSAIQNDVSVKGQKDYKPLLSNIIERLLQNEKDRKILKKIDSTIDTTVKMCKHRKGDVKKIISGMVIRALSFLDYRIKFQQPEDHNQETKHRKVLEKNAKSNKIPVSRNSKIENDNQEQEIDETYTEEKITMIDSQKPNQKDETNGKNKGSKGEIVQHVIEKNIVVDQNQGEKENNKDNSPQKNDKNAKSKIIPVNHNKKTQKNNQGIDETYTEEKITMIDSQKPNQKDETNGKNKGSKGEIVQHVIEENIVEDQGEKENKKDNLPQKNDKKARSMIIPVNHNKKTQKNNQEIDETYTEEKISMIDSQKPNQKDETNGKNKGSKGEIVQHVIEENIVEDQGEKENNKDNLPQKNDKNARSNKIQVNHNNKTENNNQGVVKKYTEEKIIILDSQKPNEKNGTIGKNKKDKNARSNRILDGRNEIGKDNQGTVTQFLKENIMVHDQDKEELNIPAKSLKIIIKKRARTLMNDPRPRILEQEILKLIVNILRNEETRKKVRRVIGKEPNIVRKFLKAKNKSKVKDMIIDRYNKIKDEKHRKSPRFNFNKLSPETKEAYEKIERDVLNTLERQGKLEKIDKRLRRKIVKAIYKKDFGHRDFISYDLIKNLLKELGYTVTGESDCCDKAQEDCVKAKEQLEQDLRNRNNLQNFNKYINGKLYDVKFASNIVHNKSDKAVYLFKTFEQELQKNQFDDSSLARALSTEMKMFRKILTYLSVMQTYQEETCYSCLVEERKIFFNKNPLKTNTIIYRQNRYDAGYQITLDEPNKLVDASIKTYVHVDNRDFNKIKITEDISPYINKGDPIPGDLKKYTTILNLEFIADNNKDVRVELELDGIDFQSLNIDLIVKGIKVKGHIIPNGQTQKEIVGKTKWKILKADVDKFDVNSDPSADLETCLV
ncbi:hypothetical protein M8J76_012254 [Diaphorina citri]|nr:hypothetical protein M8J76_012254 [Diaphorina citri]